MEKGIRAGPGKVRPYHPSHLHHQYHASRVRTVPQPGFLSLIVMAFTVFMLPCFFIGIGGIAGSGILGEKAITRLGFLDQGFRAMPASGEIQRLARLDLEDDGISS